MKDMKTINKVEGEKKKEKKREDIQFWRHCA